MRKAAFAAIGITCLLGPLAVSAQETLAVDASAARTGLELPARGTTMTQVEARYGAPAERYAPVGQPPITRWIYPSFVVYFEHSHVVHTVLRRTAAAPR
jgi:hypothetical protein